MTNTPHFNLKKPATTDFVKISDLNDNADAIDTALYNNQNAISSEASTRASADTALGGRIDSEASARQSADNALQAKLTNRNLLDNPWFTVNQRGGTSYTAPNSNPVFTCDRWKIGRGSATVLSNGMNFTSDSSSAYKWIRQHIGLLRSGTYTITMHCKVNSISGGIVFAPMRDNVTISTIGITNTGEKWITHTFSLDSDIENFGVEILASNDSSNINVDIYSVKLELGSVSTLANDTAPDYGEELRKCQRYYQRIKGNNEASPIGMGMARVANSAIVFIPYANPLRQVIVYQGSVNYSALAIGYKNSGVNAASIQAFRSSSNGIQLVLQTAESVLTAGEAVQVTLPDTTDYLEISADI